MGMFILNFIEFIFKLQEKFFAKKAAGTVLGASNATTKLFLSGCETAKFSVQTEKNKQIATAGAKKVVKKCIKNPQKLLEYVEKAGTPVYRMKNADVILNCIGEGEGFITPHFGLKGLYLNLILCKKFALKTEPMFVLRNLPVNIYFMSHQFHKWYGYKMRLPGFDDATQRLFKQIWAYSDKNAAQKLSLTEILSLKEAIARDVEAIEFVKTLAKESEGAKSALNKIKNEGSAEV